MANETFSKERTNRARDLGATPLVTGVVAAGETDAEDLDTALASDTEGLRLRPTNGVPTLWVQLRFSVTAETAVVLVGLYRDATDHATVLSKFRQTVVADASANVGGAFLSEPTPFPAAGASGYEVRILTGPSAGTVDLFAWEA